ncbi:MAG: hypothetical protein IKR76_02060 [Ruminococcus sp.]|nr:hypothetical protein [Ruminococcus sp.]
MTVKDISGRNVGFLTGTKDGKNYVEIPDIAGPELGDDYTVTFGSQGSVKVSALSFAEAALRNYSSDSSKKAPLERVTSAAFAEKSPAGT